MVITAAPEMIHLWPTPHLQGWHVDLFNHSQLVLIYRSTSIQWLLTMLITSRCHALPLVAGPHLKSAGWWMAFLPQTTSSLWVWPTLLTQMAHPPWAASSASPHTSRTRRVWPVWFNTQPSQTPNSLQRRWKPLVCSHIDFFLCACVYVCLCASISKRWYMVLHHQSEFCNHLSWLSMNSAWTTSVSGWFFTLVLASHSAPHTLWRTINHNAQYNAFIWECHLSLESSIRNDIMQQQPSK